MKEKPARKRIVRSGKGRGSMGVPKQTQKTNMSNASVVIAGVHMDLTQSLKAYVNEKAERLFRHNPKIQRILFELVHGRARDHAAEFAAQARIEVPGPDIVVRVESEDLYKSIDLLMDKLDRSLRRRHRLVKVKRHREPNGKE
jgi:putative sigma-54 modulation protein